MLKLNSLIYSVGFVLVFGGCAKDPKSVPDPGPNFSIDSLEVKMLSKGPNPTPILRDDPTSGPQIQIQGIDYTSVKSVERKLVCGPVTLAGKKAFFGDATLVNFRLAEEEFPDLSKMPSAAKCNLMVSVINNIGSTSTRVLPVTLTFDKSPPLAILRNVATAGLNPHNGNFEILLETYSIKNNLPYPVNLTFTPARQVTALVRANLVADPGPAPVIDRYDLKFLLKTTRIELAGIVTNESGDYIHSVRFTLPVGETVTLNAFSQIPSEGTTHSCVVGLFPVGSKTCRSFTGLFVVGVTEPNRSLSMSWSFESSSEDRVRPNYLGFKEDLPVPGVLPGPVLNKHDLGID